MIRRYILASIACWLTWCPATDAAAQRASGTSRFAVESVRGLPGAIIPLKIHLPAGISTAPAAKTSYTFLMFKGLPENFRLTSGFQTRNSWIVAIDEAHTLSVDTPAAYSGSFVAEVFLYRGEAVAPEREVFSVYISTDPASVPTSVNLKAVPLPAPSTTVKTPATRDPNLSKQDEEALLEQADAQIQNGNIVFARLLFEQLASQGSARGTFALARTYDPNTLKKLGAVGVQGDIEKAKDLYQRAAELWNAPGSDTVGSTNK